MQEHLSARELLEYIYGGPLFSPFESIKLHLKH